MKRISLGLILTTLVINVLGKETPPSFSYPGSVDLFGLYEISFTLPTVYSNPYDPDVILAYGVFEGPDNSTYTVNAFYYECYSFQQHNNGHEVATHNSTYDGHRCNHLCERPVKWCWKQGGLFYISFIYKKPTATNNQQHLRRRCFLTCFGQPSFG